MNNESTNNQRLNAFNLGKIVSQEQSIKGTNKLPKPPISNGVIIKGVINRPWKLIGVLYWREELGIKPGKASSNLGIMLSPTPGDAPINATNICITPINIWLVE